MTSVSWQPGVVLVIMVTSSAVDHVQAPGQTKTIKLVFAACSQSAPHYGVRVKTGWLENQDNVSK
jgi:hypothetical protein